MFSDSSQHFGSVIRIWNWMWISSEPTAFEWTFICRKDSRYSEKDAARIVRQMLSVAARCHLNGVVHRDMKPEVSAILSNRRGVTIAYDQWVHIVVCHLFTTVESIHFKGCDAEFFIQIFERRFTTEGYWFWTIWLHQARYVDVQGGSCFLVWILKRCCCSQRRSCCLLEMYQYRSC
jgi:hypothetical protein